MKSSSQGKSTLLVGASLIAGAVVTIVLWRGTRRRRRKDSYLDKACILEQRRRYFSTSNSVSYENTGPLLIVQGKGSRLYDENKVSYLDTRNNVAHCGHCHPRIVRAVQRQIATLNTNTRYLHPLVCQLAERLVECLPSNDETRLEKVFFCNSGSEANDLALRLARCWSGGSNNTIVVDGAYHGHTIATLEISPYKYETSKEYQLFPHLTTHSEEPNMVDDTSNSVSPRSATPGPHIWKVPCPDTWRGLYRDGATAGALYAGHVQEACRYYAKQGERVRAFIVEGGLSVAGVILPPPGYLRASVTAVRKAGGLYIADEVQTGLGRLGSCFWAFAHPANGDLVIPDIVTVGKPFGNGMPLAAVVTTRAVASAFEACGVEYFNTFGGNPVSAAAGLAVLNVIRDEKLQDNAQQVGSYLINQLRRLQETIDWIGDVRGSGFFIGLEFVDDRASQSPAVALTSWLCSQLKVSYHILTSIDGPYGNVLVIKPPMVFSREDADYFIDCLELALTCDLPKVQHSLVEMAKTPT